MNRSKDARQAQSMQAETAPLGVYMQERTFFDEIYYRSNYGVGGVVDPRIDYSERGWRLGYNPSPYFDTDFYLRRNSDVAGADINPLDHYLNFGWRENRSPSPHFDPAEFIQSHKGCFDQDQDPARQCILTYGDYHWKAAVAEESCAATQIRQNFLPYFDEIFYLENCASATEAGSPFAHFLESSRYIDFDPSPYFDVQFYREAIQSNYGWLSDPVYHYLRFGAQRKLATRRIGDIGRLPRTRLARYSGETSKICVHLHCYYADLVDEFLACFVHFPAGTKIVITVVAPELAHYVMQKTRFLDDQYTVDVLVVKNIGRDVAPFLTACKPIWESSDLVLHLHTKRSPHVSWGDEWRRYLIRHTIGSPVVVQSVIDYFDTDPLLGCFYPRNFAHIRRYTVQNRNGDKIQNFLSSRGAGFVDSGFMDFPAGSMSWYRVSALKAACEPAISIEDFEQESGQYDGTLAHVLERTLPIQIRNAGFKSLSYVCAPDLLV